MKFAIAVEIGIAALILTIILAKLGGPAMQPDKSIRKQDCSVMYHNRSK